jgi:hypothetical protein
MSATPDSTLTDSEQLIANLHRQLAECRAERNEALQRETATTEVLQVINSSPGDRSCYFGPGRRGTCSSRSAGASRHSIG